MGWAFPRCGMAALMVTVVMHTATGLSARSGTKQEESTFTISIEPMKAECFHWQVKAGHIMEIEFQVVSGGNLDIDYDIRNGLNQVIDSGSRRSDGLWESVATRDETYQICLRNEFSVQTAKQVFFILVVDSTENVPDEKTPDAEEDQMMQVNVVNDRIHNHLRTISFLQDHIRAREARHRKTAESNNERVQTWSIIECLVVILVGFLQIIAIRRMFKDSGRSGGV
mmetsp:Transcript_96576/g.133927  ORF Transcript_96576/g.133927 Transcript_96576/m.133927 type:complete len:226 (-) Transcript_96576:36-713(-)